MKTLHSKFAPVTIETTPSSEDLMKTRHSSPLKLMMLLTVVFGLMLSAVAQDEVVGGSGTTYQNPLQLAQKAWYPANLSAVLQGTYYNFRSPGGMVFDGSNLWIEHIATGVNKVDKVRASDGQLIGSYSVGTTSTSASPGVFDGVDIWLPDHTVGSSTVYRTVAATGMPDTSCNLGSAATWPDSAAFDGQYMWVSTNTGYVVKVNARTCQISCTTANLGSRLYDLAYDGTYMWVTAVYSNAVFKLNSNCSQASGSPIAVAGGPIGIVYDGTNLWTANQTGQSVSRIAGGVVTTYALGYTPWEIRYDGANLWITDYTAGKVSIMSATHPVANPPAYQTCGSASSSPLGLAFDGTNMWVGCEGINAIGKM